MTDTKMVLIAQEQRNFAEVWFRGYLFGRGKAIELSGENLLMHGYGKWVADPHWIFPFLRQTRVNMSRVMSDDEITAWCIGFLEGAWAHKEALEHAA